MTFLEKCQHKMSNMWSGKRHWFCAIHSCVLFYAINRCANSRINRWLRLPCLITHFIQI